MFDARALDLDLGFTDIRRPHGPDVAGEIRRMQHLARRGTGLMREMLLQEMMGSAGGAGPAQPGSGGVSPCL